MIIVPRESALYVRLTQLAEQRMVFFAGLPGTGKSLLIHQLAHLADTTGRTVHLLQWDVARPVFEATPAAARYPMERGVTHALIRKALGVWVRRAVAAWQRDYPEPRHLLIGETPLVGHRFIELARRVDDSAEPLLAAPSCRFVIPVPTRDVRRVLERERERRIRRPRHAREREDAAPHVVRGLWEHVVAAAQALGVDAARQPPPVPFDPLLYERVYRRLLTHRHAQSLPVDTLLPTSGLTVYTFTHPTHDLMPTPEEAAGFIEAVEHASPHPDALDEEMTRWYIV